MNTLFEQIQDAQHVVNSRMQGPKTPDQLAETHADQRFIDSAQALMIRRGAVAVEGLISRPNTEIAAVPSRTRADSRNLTSQAR